MSLLCNGSSLSFKICKIHFGFFGLELVMQLATKVMDSQKLVRWNAQGTSAQASSWACKVNINPKAMINHLEKIASTDNKKYITISILNIFKKKLRNSGHSGSRWLLFCGILLTTKPSYLAVQCSIVVRTTLRRKWQLSRVIQS